ncbi:hypothetical protein BDZ89DRAFT_1064169 [Hymenopellis radicata]|nr:hypothetical protein BDZ89DRAFT_1064169 [Hymenopellis radicata]
MRRNSAPSPRPPQGLFSLGTTFKRAISAKAVESGQQPAAPVIPSTPTMARPSPTPVQLGGQSNSYHSMSSQCGARSSSHVPVYQGGASITRVPVRDERERRRSVDLLRGLI